MKIFLDLDGPVLDVSERYYQVFLSICKGNIKLSREKFWKLKKEKRPWSKIFAEIDFNIEEEKFLNLWMKQIEMKKYLILDKIQPYVKKTLSSLNKKYVLYLISLRQSRMNLFWQIEGLNIKKYFQKIIHCKYGFNKPWYEKARIIRENINHIERALIIGDTEVDIRAAKLAGIKSVGITSGIRTKQFLTNEKPDFLISDFKGLLQIIN